MKNADGVVRLAVTADTKQAKQDIKELQNDVVKSNDSLETQLKKDMEKRLEERKKLFERYLDKEVEEEIKRGEKGSKQQIKEGLRSTFTFPGEGGYNRFVNPDTNDIINKLEAPVEYEEVLKKELDNKLSIARVNELIKKQEEEIAKEEEKQNKEEEKKKKEKKKQLFLDSLKKGVNSILTIIQLISGAILALGVAIGMLGLSGFLTLLAGSMKKVREENQLIVNKMAYLKAMIQSAYRALTDIATNILNTVLDTIIKIAYYIDYIVQKWFNFSFLQSTSEEYKKNMKEAEKSAKEIRKQLMGFDEANILGEKEKDTSKLTPTEYSFGDVKIPAWVDWIAKNKDTIIRILELAGIIFSGATVSKWLFNIAKLFGFGAAGVFGGSGLAGLFYSLGCIVAIATGIAIIAYVTASTWADLQKMWDDLEEIWKQQQKVRQGWVDMLDPMNEVDVNKDLNTIGSNITNAWSKLQTINAKPNSKAAKEYAKLTREVTENSEKDLEFLKKALENDNLSLETKQRILAKMEEIYVFNTENIRALEKQGENTDVLRHINDQYADEIYKVGKQLGKNKEEIDKNIISIDKAWNSYDAIFKTVQDINNQKIADKNFKITYTMQDMTGPQQTMGNFLVSTIKTLILQNGLVKAIPHLKDVLLDMLSNMDPVKILNMAQKYNFLDGGGVVLPVPGHGVPVMSERRAEAVIPFENPEVMEMLGQAIGKYVNLSIDNKMIVDSQVLATAVSGRMNKEDFLMNR